MSDPKETAGTEKTGRTRLIIDTDDTINAAAQLRASKESVKQKRRVSKSDVVNDILRRELAQEIAELEEYSGPPADPKPGRRKGASG